MFTPVPLACTSESARAKLVAEFQRTIQSEIQRANANMSAGNIREVPLPRVILTSSERLRNPLGHDELRVLVGEYEQQLFGFLEDLKQTIYTTFETFARDLDGPTPQDGTTRSFRAMSDHEHAQLVADMGALVRRVTSGFESDMREQCAEFLDRARRVIYEKSWGFGSIALQTMRYKTESNHWTLDHLVSGGGEYVSPARGPLNVNADVAESAINVDLWLHLCEVLERKGTTQLTTESLSAINAALELARQHPHFRNQQSAQQFFQPIGSIQRDVLQGELLAFTDTFFPEEIRNARRNFLEDVTSAVRNYAISNGFYQHDHGTGKMDRMATHTQPCFDRHREQVLWL